MTGFVLQCIHLIDTGIVCCIVLVGHSTLFRIRRHELHKYLVLVGDIIFVRIFRKVGGVGVGLAALGGECVAQSGVPGCLILRTSPVVEGVVVTGHGRGSGAGGNLPSISSVCFRECFHLGDRGDRTIAILAFSHHILNQCLLIVGSTIAAGFPIVVTVPVVQGVGDGDDILRASSTNRAGVVSID